MSRERITSALRTGVFVCAATAGAVVGIGLRRGDALGPFIGAGRILLSTSRGLVPLPWLAFVGGVAQHVVLMLFVGGLFALIAVRARGVVLAVAAALYAALVALGVSSLGNSALGAFGTLAASGAQWFFLLALLAAALFTGVLWSRVSD